MSVDGAHRPTYHARLIVRLTERRRHRPNSAGGTHEAFVFHRLVLILSAAAFAQSDDIVPNENLVAEGIPKIPAALAESAGRYGEFRSAGFPSWNPAKREMLIETRFADTQPGAPREIPGGARTQLTFFPDRVAGAQYQPTKGRFLPFLQRHRRRRVLPDLSLRRQHRRRHPADRRQIAQHRSPLVVSRRSNRLRIHQRTGADVDIWIVNANDPASARMVGQWKAGLGDRRLVARRKAIAGS